jgi:hypothetical protein
MTGSRAGSIMTFAQVAQMIDEKFGVKPSVSTIWRWAKKGIGGKVLETIRIGRWYRTTPEAVERFLEQLSQGECQMSDGTAQTHHEPAIASARSQRAEADGIIRDSLAETKERLQQYRIARKCQEGGDA